MARSIMTLPWRVCGIAVFAILLLSSFASAKIQASEKGSVASYSATQIEEELQVFPNSPLLMMVAGVFMLIS